MTGGDIDPKELIVGSAESIDGVSELKAAGVAVHLGVKAAFADLLSRVEKTIKD